MRACPERLLFLAANQLPDGNWYKAPDVYTDDRKFLVDFCGQLQEFYFSDERVLVVNMPPRHGKSRTISCFVEWALGRDQSLKVMTGSYNETLSTNFSKNVRNTISEVKADADRIIWSDIFPGITIRRGDGAMNMWSLSNGYNNYLATSPTGTATGFGASLLVIDDLIKSALEANNAALLEDHWTWFTDTMLSRLEEGGKIIIVMTRWHSEDLAGSGHTSWRANSSLHGSRTAAARDRLQGVSGRRDNALSAVAARQLVDTLL